VTDEDPAFDHWDIEGDTGGPGTARPGRRSGFFRSRTLTASQWAASPRRRATVTDDDD
jgi:hypothetical protein